jgi:hypothetical protein
MQAVRDKVQNEIEILNAQEPPVPRAPTAEPSLTSLRTSDIEDLNKAGKIATDFLTGMDRIADVLMLLVMKFGRASTMMRGVFIGMAFAVLLLAGNLLALWHIVTIQTAIQEEQGKIQKQQAQILERQNATQKVAGEAKEQAAAAAQKAQNAPEVGVDAKGRIILKVPDPGAPGETQVIRLPTQTPQR